VSEAEVLHAIESITDETGFPPDAEELAAALEVSTQQIHSALMQAKRRGDVRYDADSQRLLLTDQWLQRQR
jgi:DNA-directed RNA polymerase specialized sigma subunit